MSELGMFSMGGNRQNAFQQHQQKEDVEMSGGRRRRRSRTRRRGRRGRGGYLTDVAVAAGLLGATQLGKARYNYYGPTRRRGSRRSRRSRS
jgi:hypothetical protein